MASAETFSSGLRSYCCKMIVTLRVRRRFEKVDREEDAKTHEKFAHQSLHVRLSHQSSKHPDLLQTHTPPISNTNNESSPEIVSQILIVLEDVLPFPKQDAHGFEDGQSDSFLGMGGEDSKKRW